MPKAAILGGMKAAARNLKLGWHCWFAAQKGEGSRALLLELLACIMLYLSAFIALALVLMASVDPFTRIANFVAPDTVPIAAGEGNILLSTRDIWVAYYFVAVWGLFSSARFIRFIYASRSFAEKAEIAFLFLGYFALLIYLSLFHLDAIGIAIVIACFWYFFRFQFFTKFLHYFLCRDASRLSADSSEFILSTDAIFLISLIVLLL